MSIPISNPAQKKCVTVLISNSDFSFIMFLVFFNYCSAEASRNELHNLQEKPQLDGIHVPVLDSSDEDDIDDKDVDLAARFVEITFMPCPSI